MTNQDAEAGRDRRNPALECDTVILAVGETFDMDFCRASGLELKEEGTIIVDRFSLETSRPGFYAGGDVITGASNVSQRHGLRQTGRPQHRPAAHGRRPLGPDLPRVRIRPEGAGGPEQEPPSRLHMPLPEVRVGSHDEVVLGLSPEEALEEACRCLRCDVKTHVSVS